MGILKDLMKTGCKAVNAQNYYDLGRQDAQEEKEVNNIPQVIDKRAEIKGSEIMDENGRTEYYMRGYADGQTERINKLTNDDE